MADNEFEARQERNERIKNAEYQFEEEQMQARARREKENKKLERARAKEKKKEAEQRKLMAEQRKQAEAKKIEQKKQKEEAREIMEQQRKAKDEMKNGKKKKNASVNSVSSSANSRAASTEKVSVASREVKVEKTSTTEKVMTASTVIASTESLAKDSVQTDIYVDGNRVTERDLTSDLIKKIRKEQGKVVAQTEEELKSTTQQNEKLTDKERIMESTDPDLVANNRVRRGSENYTMAAGAASVASVGSPFDVSVQDKNVNINGNYGIDGNSSSNAGSRNSSRGNNEGIFIDPDENSGEDESADNNQVYQEPELPLNDREALRANLAGANNRNRTSKQNPNSIFTDGTNENDNNLDGNLADSRSDLGTAAGLGAATGLGAGMAADGATRTRRRVGVGTVDTPQSPADDIDSRLTNNITSGLGRGARMAGSAGKGAVKAGKTVATAVKAGKVATLGPIIAGAGVIIIILLALIGATSFIMNMPGMVRDKIVNTFDTLWQEAKGLIVGKDAVAANPTAIKNLAEYLEDMGYDLMYNGFATELEKDKDGNIKDIESKYLAAYIAAEERSYLIANENHNVKAIWEGVSSIFGDDPKWDEPWGTGMIVLENTLVEQILSGVQWGSIKFDPYSFLNSVTDGLSDFFTGKVDTRNTEVKDVSSLSMRVIIKRDTKEMFLSKVDIIDVFNTGGYDVYRYSLKEWTEKYGTPTELFLTLHLATRAPEFAYKFATTYDTKVFLEIKELQNVSIDLVYAETDANNRVRIDENGQPIMKPISQLSDAELKAKGISDEALKEMRSVSNKITAFTPYITKVMNHWYYQQIVYQGEHNGRNIDVYEVRNLAPGDDGYERYYAYTRRDNSDSEHIKDDTQKVDPAADSWFGSLINTMITVIKAYYTAGMSLVWDQTCDKLMDQAYAQLEDQMLSFMPEEFANVFNGYDQFFKDGWNWDDWGSIPDIDVGNMSKYLDFDKITDFMNVDNLQLNADKLLGELNIQDTIMNMDLGNLGSINDLQNVVGNLDLNNLNSVFDNNFSNIVDLGGTNFDGFANLLSSGISIDSIESIQDSILGTFDKVVTGLSDAEFSAFSDQFLGDLSKQISDFTSAPILDQLNGSISDIVAGKFDSQVLNGLQNEFSKQVTGLSYNDLSKMAEIPNMDLDQIKNLSGQVTGITSTLTGAENSIENLSSQANKLSKDITGMDTRVLNSVASSITNLDNKVTSLGNEITQTKDVLNSTGASKTEIKNAINQVEALENKVNRLKNAGDKLNLEEITRLQSEIDTAKRDLSKTINAIEGLDDINLNKIKSQVSRLENQATDVIDHITSLDTVRLETVLSKIEKLDKTGLVDLATDLSKLDVSSNGMQDLVKKYGDDITGLKTSEINQIMNLMNGKNLDAQDAINGISKYLLNSDQNELARNLNKLGGTVELLENYTVNLDTKKIINLTEKITGFDSSHLNNFANQISRLENASINDLLGNIEKLPNKLLNQVSKQITDKVTEGIKDQVSSKISSNLKNNILGSNGFSGAFKNCLTSGDQMEGLDPETQDEPIENPYAEYSTGFYIREIRNSDYFQIAEPLRVLYPASHWRKMFREDKYIILDKDGIDMDKINDEEYVEKYGKTIWEATDGDVETAIYAMLQGVQSSNSQYLYRYFKELFNDFSWIFDGNWGFSVTQDPSAINPETIGWIFKTAEVEEPIFSGDLIEHSKKTIEISQEEWQQPEVLESIAKKNKPTDADFYTYECHVELSEDVKDFLDEAETDFDYTQYDGEETVVYLLEVTYFKYENRDIQKVTKTEYQPATWAASQIGILSPKSQDQVYGFKEGLDIISPVNGVVVAKTNASRNELGERVAESVTIELRNTGDKNADGMRIILIGGDYSTLMIGSLVEKVTYVLDEEGNFTGETAQSVIGKTTDETIKVMVLDKDGTPVDNISDYLHPPFENDEYKPELGS